MEEKELISCNDEFLIGQVEAILKENEIPYIRKDQGAGGYMNISFGQNINSEKKIIVNSEDYNKAKNLIEFLNGENMEDDIPEELKDIEEDIEEDIKVKKNYKLPMRIILIIILLMFASLTITFIKNMVYSNL